MTDFTAELTTLLAQHPWVNQLIYKETTDSTSTDAKAMAAAGAAEGLVVIAGEQTAGRGQKGRSFYSAEGLGLYLSAVFRPDIPAADLQHFTAMAGVAVCDAVEAVCGRRPTLKWPNDIIFDGRKLGGILTELVFRGSTIDYLVVGIGINVGHAADDFPPELAELATSLFMATSEQHSRPALAAQLIEQLALVRSGLLDRREEYLSRYRQDCAHIGTQVLLHRNGQPPALALCTGIDATGALLVTHPDGRKERLISGEVTLRTT